MKLALIIALLAPTFAFAADVRASPEQVVLGRDRRVEITVDSPGVIGSTSAGTLGHPTSSGDETRFVWTPPDSGSPRVAVLLFWQPGADSADVSVLRVPLLGRTELGIDTEPNAEVRVTIAGKTFGPRHADAAGRVKVPVEVPPGARSAAVAAESHGRVKQREVPLPLPADTGFAIAAGPAPLARDGTGWALVISSDAQRTPPELRARGAELSRSGAGHGRAEYALRPTAATVELVAGRHDERHSYRLEVVAHPPPRPEVARGPTALRFDGFAQLGGFYAGGANDGYAIVVGAGVGPFFGGHLFAELSVGLRHTGYSRGLTGLGTLHSAVTGFPIELSGRAPLWALGPVRLAARAGGGLVPFRHSLSSDFEQGFSEPGLGWELFAAVDASLPLGRFEPFLEVAGAIAPVSTDRLDASFGGIRVLLGGRFSP